MAISKAELRTLAIEGVRTKINWHRNEIAKYLEEFPELQTNGPALQSSPPPSHVSRDPTKPTIRHQTLTLLSGLNEPIRAAALFAQMITLPVPATKNETSVYAELAKFAKEGLVKRNEENAYSLTAKGKKHADELKAAPTGGHA